MAEARKRKYLDLAQRSEIAKAFKQDLTLTIDGAVKRFAHFGVGRSQLGTIKQGADRILELAAGDGAKLDQKRNRSGPFAFINKALLMWYATRLLYFWQSVLQSILQVP